MNGNGLRKIELDLGLEFGLKKHLIVTNLNINLGEIDKGILNKERQCIEVEYYVTWTDELSNTIVKQECGMYINDNSDSENLFLDKWDTMISQNEFGKLISDGILYYLTTVVFK